MERWLRTRKRPVSSLGVGGGVALYCAGLACNPAASPSAGSGRADYGDAPDGTRAGYENGAVGHFPTRASSDGVRVLNEREFWLGQPASLEDDADDSRDPDGHPNLDRDRDDGLVAMTLDRTGSPPRASITLDIGTRGARRDLFLNVLVDLDQDGRWRDGGDVNPEWSVRNFAIALAEADRRTINREFAYASGARVPSAAWMRVLLTDQRVADDWDGRGVFENGEVEDYLVELATAAGSVDVDCRNPSSGAGQWSFDGGRTTRVACQFRSAETVASNAGAQSVEFDLVRQNGGVRHTGICGASPVSLTGTTGANVHVGPVALSRAATTVECTYEKGWPLPSSWKLELRLPTAPSIPTERGIRLGHGGRLSAAFKIEKGTCPRSCQSDHQCIGDEACTDHCCVPAWAAECAGMAAEACGRCCAVTGGVHAPDCVRQACAQ